MQLGIWVLPEKRPPGPRPPLSKSGLVLRNPQGREPPDQIVDPRRPVPCRERYKSPREQLDFLDREGEENNRQQIGVEAETLDIHPPAMEPSKFLRHLWKGTKVDVRDATPVDPDDPRRRGERAKPRGQSMKLGTAKDSMQSIDPCGVRLYRRL